MADDDTNAINLGRVSSIISLGYNCWSRVFTEQFHLYDYGRRSVRMPFDGCITKYNCLCSLLESNFANFFDGMKVEVDHNGKDVIRTAHGYYQHEHSADFDEFKNQNHKRISQFEREINESILQDTVVVFFLQHGHHRIHGSSCFHDGHPTKLIGILRKKYPELKFKIFCVNNKVGSGKKLRNENTEFCKYFETREKCGANDSNKEVLREFLSFLTDISGINYDFEKILSVKVKNANIDYDEL